MQSENLLRADYPMEHNNNLSNSNSPINSPDQDQITNQSSGYYNNSDYLTQPSEAADYNSVPPGAFHSIQGNNVVGGPGSQNTIDSSSNEMTPSGVAGLLPQQSITSPTATTPQLQVAPAMTQVVPTQQILGSTPLSQIGCPPLSIDHFGGQSVNSPNSPSSDELDSELDSNNDELGSYYNSRSKRQKRGILPKHATSVMRAWLFQHIVVSLFRNFYYYYFFKISTEWKINGTIQISY